MFACLTVCVLRLLRSWASLARHMSAPLLREVFEEVAASLEERVSELVAASGRLSAGESRVVEASKRASLRAAAAAQALWALSRQRSDLTRCLRATAASPKGVSEGQKVVELSLLTLRLLEKTLAATDRVLQTKHRCCPGLEAAPHSGADSEALQFIDAATAWASARAARALAELSRCVVLALKSGVAKQQGSRRRSGLTPSQLDCVSEALLHFAERQLQSAAMRAAGTKEGRRSGRGVGLGRLDDAFTDTRLKSASVALCAFFKTPAEFLPLQRHCAEAANLLCQAFRLLPRLSRSA